MWIQSLGGKTPWRRAWQPTPVFLPGDSHGPRSLVGHSPKGHRELDTTEVTQHAAHTFPQTPKIMDGDKQCGHILILICLCFLWETSQGGVALVCDKMWFGYPYIHTNGII